MPKCRDCNAEIRFLTTRKGKKIPVDAEPVAAEDFDPEDLLISEDGTVMQAERWAKKVNVTDLFVAHFANCPYARPR